MSLISENIHGSTFLLQGIMSTPCHQQHRIRCFNWETSQNEKHIFSSCTVVQKPFFYLSRYYCIMHFLKYYLYVVSFYNFGMIYFLLKAMLSVALPWRFSFVQNFIVVCFIPNLYYTLKDSSPFGPECCKGCI
jgi:hypothetical protein